MIGSVTGTWEAGSQMDWRGGLLAASSADAVAALPDGHEIFATGTGALLALGRLLRRADGGRPRLHVPSYFCMDVVRNLKKAFDIRWYHDLPTETGPDFATINYDDGDVVLAANMFGVRDGAAWWDWLLDHDRVILVEDHSHDPFSPWAAHSQAHYAMASLRKTLPLPDGALIWSPKGLELPKPHPSESSGAHVKLAGMLLKNAYLEGASFSKDLFRAMEVESEDELARDTGNAASQFTTNVLGLLRTGDFRHRRTANIETFRRLSKEREHPHWRLLFDSWPEGTAPFGAILVCRDNPTRDALRRHLIGQNVFAAVHWPRSDQDDAVSADDPAVDLSSRILTIPSDQRYDGTAMEHIFERVASYPG